MTREEMLEIKGRKILEGLRGWSRVLGLSEGEQLSVKLSIEKRLPTHEQVTVSSDGRVKRGKRPINDEDRRIIRERLLATSSQEEYDLIRDSLVRELGLTPWQISAVYADQKRKIRRKRQ